MLRILVVVFPATLMEWIVSGALFPDRVKLLSDDVRFDFFTAAARYDYAHGVRSADGSEPETRDVTAAVVTPSPLEVIPLEEDGLVAPRWDEDEAVRAAASGQLHPTLQRAAADRLATIYRGASIILTVYLALVMAAAWAARAGRGEGVGEGVGVGAGVGAGGIEGGAAAAWPLASALVLSLVMVVGGRALRPRPETAGELGYVYLVALSLLLALHAHLGVPPVSASLVHGVSPAVFPLLAFGALVPATPKRALMAYVAAAATDPLALVMLRGGTQVSVAQAALSSVAPLVAALSAFGISRTLHRLTEGIVKAREVGSYRLVERLGVGGMAEVWRADHHMLARPAAVKLIRPAVLSAHGPADAQRLLRLFAREARATASLSSPHTISVYDFGITREGSFYYVMELLDGIDLQTLVTRFGPQPSARVAHLLMNACHSLGEAHDKDFVHRDVKPGNIFACHLGGELDFVKVLDFGLVLDRHPTPEELEDEQHFVGTPAVMAPEMVRFHAPVDRRADLYALGCVGYWLLTGHRVFEAQTRHDMLVMHAHQKPLPPSRRATLPIDPGLESIVMSCLEKNPDRRPQTARELRERLLALRFDEPWTEERARLWWMEHPAAGRRAERTR